MFEVGHTFSVSSENKEEELKYQWSSKFFPKKFVILGGETIEKSSKIAVKCLYSAFENEHFSVPGHFRLA